MAKYFDQYGVEQDGTWLLENFGPVHVSGSSERYDVAELREIVGPTALTAIVYRENGAPARGVSVTMGWPDGADLALTNALGEAGFPMGPGSWYWPPETGPQHLEVDGLRVSGLGMKGNTNHVHLDVTFQERSSTPQPEPPTSDETAARWAMLFQKLDTIIELLRG